MQRITEANESEIKKIMHDAEIQSVSIASGTNKDNIVSRNIPIDDFSDKKEKVDDPVFGAASLSKPVFTYLVLKLINDEDFKLDTKLNEILPFEKFCKMFDIEWDNSEKNINRVNLFTPDMILSHQTGIPIGYRKNSGPLTFDFEPGEGFGYSGIHLMYLQQCIEIKFGPLNELAKKFVFDPAGMTTKSTFNTPEANAANSLQTTATDYARFCIYWMQDQDPRVQNAFISKVSMLKDPWAVREEVSPDILNHLWWGYGWGLEKDDSGKVMAFHTGDMGEWRAGVQLDLNAKSVKVFLSKSSYENGHLLQDPIFGKSYALDYFFDKFKFARTVNELKEDWRENRSFGIRKESIKHSNKMMSSTTSILAAVSSNPLEVVKNQQSKSTLEIPNQNSPEKSKANSTEEQSPAINTKDEDKKTDKSPKPFSTKPLPPGYIK